ncbi:BglG family transcription antiterminator [Fusobacterium sp.]|uniref:BglG family transcription antiterminator n=1 Tax=Fusobacterium sp. TaxID=68766 RepID=UPI00344EB364
MLTSRSIRILKFILNQNEKIPLKDIAENFGVSERTIRYEIDKINEELKEKIEILLNKGECWLRNKDKVLEILKESNTYIPSSKERELFILLKICLVREIKQSKISEVLDISKSTVKAHIRDIRKILEIYNLTLEILPRKGLVIVGSEEQIRQCTLKTITLFKKEKSKFLENVIQEYLGNINQEGIKLFINYCQKLMEKIISDEAYEIILKYIVLVIYFNQSNKKIINIKNSNFLENTKEYEAVIKSKALLEGFYEMEFSKDEYLKITDYFLGSHTYNITYSYYENWVEIEVIVKNFIEKVNKELEVNITNDETLILGLINHIKPTIYRIKNGIELENSIYEEVAESYPNLFSIVKKGVEELENFINIKFTNDEIAFLTIHFKAAVDRNIKIKKEKLKVLIVCGSGYGSSKLLAQQIKDLYRVEIVDTIPRYLLEKVERRKDIDLILTTVSLDDFITSRDIIRVNPILSKEDIQHLDNYPIPRDNKKILFSQLIEVLEKNSDIIITDKLLNSLKNFLDTKLIDDICQEKNTIFDLLPENRIILKGKATNWEEAIIEAGSLLLNDGCIEKEYIDEMIKIVKEFGSYILFVPKVIFPHAKTKNKVKKTGFSMVVYENGIKFLENKKINIVICFCSKNEKEHLDSLVDIIENFEENSLLKSIKRAKTAKDILKYMVQK